MAEITKPNTPPAAPTKPQVQAAKPQAETKKPELNDDYAQSLLRSVTMDFEQRQAAKPHQKHLISKKTIIIIVVSTILSILIGVVVNHAASSKNSGTNTQQVINGAVNAGNPNAY